MRGRKPKPTAQKRLDGNPGKRKLNDREPELASGIPVAPDWLTDAAREEWYALVADLAGAGVVTPADKGVLAVYCQTLSHMGSLERDRKKRKTVGERLERKSMVTYRELATILRSMASELGISPASRSRIHVSLSDDGDSFDSFTKARIAQSD